MVHSMDSTSSTNCIHIDPSDNTFWFLKGLRYEETKPKGGGKSYGAFIGKSPWGKRKKR